MVKRIKSKSLPTSVRKFASFATGMLLLPIFAACAPNETVQVPPTTDVPPATDVVTPEPLPTATPGAVGNQSITDVVQTNPSLTTLRNLINEANLPDQLGDGPYTLFAPSDQAFAALPEATQQRLLQPENLELLRQVLAYHVVRGNLAANQLQSQELNTLGNNPLNIQVNQGTNEVRVNDARVVQPDIQANNGVVHIVDRVILPPTIQ